MSALFTHYLSNRVNLLLHYMYNNNDSLFEMKNKKLHTWIENEKRIHFDSSLSINQSEK